MLRKISLILLSVAMVISLVACGSKEYEDSGSESKVESINKKEDKDNKKEDTSNNKKEETKKELSKEQQLIQNTYNAEENTNLEDASNAQ